MATANFGIAPGGEAASDFIQERFGIKWGPDVFGIAEGGFTAESDGTAHGGTFKLTLVGRLSREDAEKIIALLWEMPAADKENPA